MKKQFNAELGKKFSNRDDVLKIINRYYRQIMPNTKNFKVGPLWGKNASSYAQMEEKVFVFGHQFYPVRRLGKVIRAPQNVAVKGLHEDLQFCFVPIAINHETGKVLDPVYFERKPVNLVTKRRGCWFPVLENVDLDDAVDVYDRFVSKMMYAPDPKEESSLQLDLNTDLSKWQQGKRKKRKSRVSKKRPRMRDSEEEKSAFETVKMPKKKLKREETNQFADEDDFWKAIYGDGVTTEAVENCELVKTCEDESADSENDNRQYESWVNNYYETE